MSILGLKKNIFLFIFFGIGIVPLFDLFHPGFPITHDGQDHVARIANFYQNLMEGNIVPRWAGNLNWGYGHPILMFLYPLPSYIASFFHFLGFSFADSLKIVFGLGFIASGLSMYFWIKEFLGEEAGIISAVMYLFAPYRFVDLYVRGAIGEHVAFIFPPLICYFLLKLSNKYEFWYVAGGIFSFAGLILSHNAITIMFIPIIFAYAIYLVITNKNKRLVYQYISILILGFGISSFFLLPAFLEGKYTLRDIVTRGEYSKGFVGWKDFLYGQWSYGGSGVFTVQVGIMQWIMVIGAIFVTLKKGIQHRYLLVGSIVLFLLTLFIMTSSSKVIWETITILQKFQFPWRFLSVVVFLTALIGGIVTVVFFPKKQKKVLVCGVLVGVLLLSKNYWHANGYLQKPEAFFTGIYNGTTDTGESAPIWSVRFMEQQPKSRIEVIGGSATVVENKRTSTRHEYTIEAITDVAQIRENTLYFPGWEVLANNKPTSIEFQSGVNRGVITFFLEKGKHSVVVKFGETKLRYIANIISVVSLATLLFWSILNKRKLWPHFR